MLLRGQGRQDLKTREHWRENETLYSRKGLLPIAFLLNASFQTTWSVEAVAWMMALVGRWGNRGPEDAQIIPMFILAQVSTRQHFEEADSSPEQLWVKYMTTTAATS